MHFLNWWTTTEELGFFLVFSIFLCLFAFETVKGESSGNIVGVVCFCRFLSIGICIMGGLPARGPLLLHTLFNKDQTQLLGLGRGPDSTCHHFVALVPESFARSSSKRAIVWSSSHWTEQNYVKLLKIIFIVSMDHYWSANNSSIKADEDQTLSPAVVLNDSNKSDQYQGDVAAEILSAWPITVAYFIW